MKLEHQVRQQFQQTVWDYYHEHGRHDLPWRLARADGTFDPYHILVSEVMLQQTQVSRVVTKYHGFLQLFPTISSLASAPLADVLRAWSGLGYNRRAKYLHHAAQLVMADYGGALPQTTSELIKLPGIGLNTAGALLAYAFNDPVVFIETNIRTVFINHFYRDKDDITDKAILELISQTLDPEHPREWYWALMDYGAYLKKTIGNLNQQSKHYTKQSSFAGSKRHIRGQVLRLLGEQPYTKNQLAKTIVDERLSDVIEDLLQEGLIIQKGSRLSL